MSGDIKCVVWDLDNTLWHGILSEGAGVGLRPEAREVIELLDSRGIVQSIASRNHAADAEARLRELGLWDYFLYPQIHWGSKVDSLRQVAQKLNIATDALAFADDDPFERASVQHALPEIDCLDVTDITALPWLPRLNPRFITEDSRLRRLSYQQDAARHASEQGFTGTEAEFLATLGMKFAVFRAGEGDLARAEELTLRTHQLNSTGTTYSFEELQAFRSCPHHELLMATLEDRFGQFGRIGLALIERAAGVWYIRLLLMSCRVMSRGAGSVLLNHIISRAAAAGVKLRAEFVPNDRNRVMAVTYGFAGFELLQQQGVTQILELAEPSERLAPDYVELDARL